MPVVTLRFSVPEERDELVSALRGARSSYAIEEIGQQVFRPARKHGYSDPEVTALINLINSKFNEEQFPAEELISLLEKKFYEILGEHGLNNEESVL